ncbi:MAG TPA: TonB-dependent receptor [Rhodanobacteraceae bacterium]|nr:TonB-dependent receptor [Rhodanobacteraceae bacterium]
MPHTRTSTAGRVLAVIGFAGVGVAAAQDANAPATQKLPDIVVTATRTEQSSFDVPASIDSVAIGDATDTLAVNPSEFLETVPGVLARDRQNYAQDEQISIRGFGARATFGVRGVRLYTDGIPATMPDGQGQVSHFNLDSADRVEVLRGPFSALYGNSSGGVIQLFTADGSDPGQIKTGLVGQSYDTWRASINARGVYGPTDYNLDFTHFQTDGYRDHSAAQRESGNGKLNIKVGDGGKLTLLLNTVNLPSAQDPLGLTRAQFESDPQQASPVALLFNTRKSVQQSQGGAIYEQQFGGGSTLRMMGYYGQRDVTQYLAIPVATQGNPLHSGGVVDLGGKYGGTDIRWTWKGDLAGRPFEIATGVNYDRQEQGRKGYENFVGDTLGVRGALRRNEDDTVFDFDQYAQLTWHFTDAWSLTAGARHSEVKFDSADHYITDVNPDDSGNVGYSATTPVAGLMWRVSDTTHLYASYGKGFETPTFNELAYRADGGSGLAFNLVPAKSKNGELGIKLRPTQAIDATFAVFRADTDNELSIATNSGGRTTYQNIGEARRQGAEAGLGAQLGDDWRLQVALTWLDATFRSDFLTCPGTPCTSPTLAPAGTRIPGVPKQDFFASLQWGHDVGWRASMKGTYVGSVPVNDINTDSAPSYFVFGIDAGDGFNLASGQLRTFFSIDNLFDRNYVGSVIVNDGNGRYFEPAPGRTYTLGVQWLWTQ